MGLFNSLFKSSASDEVRAMLSNGATVIDVRTPAEYNGGHVKGFVNVPLQEFKDRLDEVKAISKPIVLCCASGARSGRALSILKKERADCANGGGWHQVKEALGSTK